jgi:SNF2 family DNA or RNA helicase
VFSLNCLDSLINFVLLDRAGAVGINLTQANRVFLMEPCFNPALERQAIGRVHRLGQKRNVEITRFIMDNSVESRIVEMLKIKYGNGEAKKGEGNGEGSKDEEEDDDDYDDHDNISSSKDEEEDKKPAAKPTPKRTSKPSAEPAPAAVTHVGSLASEKVTVLTEEFGTFSAASQCWIL